MSMITLGLMLVGILGGVLVFLAALGPPPDSLSGLVGLLLGDLSSRPLTPLPVLSSFPKLTLTMILSPEVKIDFSEVELSLNSSL